MKNVVLILAFVWILRRVFFFTGFCTARNRGQNIDRMIMTRSSELKYIVFSAFSGNCIYFFLFYRYFKKRYQNIK